MSTYNGSKFLKQQIESIRNQTYSNWELYIRDDDSTDNTLEILKNYELIDKRIHLVNTIDNNVNLGPKNSFFELLQETNADYYFFCDQDDYWEKTKIKKMIDVLKCIKEPCIVYCGIKCVDQNLNPVNHPFEESVGSMDGKSFIDRGICNDMPGCTMAFNKKVHHLFMRTTSTHSIRMHDWWLTLITAAFGKVIFLPEKLVKYRLHSNNTVGAGEKKAMIKKLTSFKRLKERIAFINSTVNQQREFFLQYKELINNEDKNYLTAISNPQKNRFLIFRANTIFKYHPKSCNKFRTFVYYTLFIFLKRKFN
ncbi:rhamnosyltransferase [Liquorilactobacillus vini DSM 20605]|uniref:Rhamnosyltransferase n=2 Tax=Liquorilactobacillus vini TaxID=238015 RepID=A0A0R2BXX0_9LACO|nr:rhamnosyltransferase [Liquorilactobacillus vini DSM 20605]